jgi:hypothetical protein
LRSRGRGSGWGRRNKTEKTDAHNRAYESPVRRFQVKPTNEIGLARIYTFLGQTDRALDWLRQGIENRQPFIVNMKYEPTFASMRKDPRFIALVKAAGIP